MFADVSNIGCIKPEPLPSPFHTVPEGYNSPLTPPKLGESIQLVLQELEYILAGLRDFLQLLRSTQVVVVFRVDGSVYCTTKNFHSVLVRSNFTCHSQRGRIRTLRQSLDTPLVLWRLFYEHGGRFQEPRESPQRRNRSSWLSTPSRSFSLIQDRIENNRYMLGN